MSGLASGSFTHISLAQNRAGIWFTDLISTRVTTYSNEILFNDS